MPTFEPLRGSVPDLLYGLLDRHPHEPLLALRIEHPEAAAIWNSDTGALVEAPDDAVALCWRKDGAELLVLRSVYERKKALHRVIVTALQSEYRHFLEARSWPEQELLGQIAVYPPTGWLVRVVASPTQHLVAYRWQEQGSSGIEFVDLTEGRQTGLRYRGPLMLDGPVFSPDGNFVVLSAGEDSFWWSPNGEPGTPAAGGATRAGMVVVGDLKEERFEEIPLEVQLHAGWLPDDPEEIGESQWIPPVVFLDGRRFEVKLPTGEKRILSLPS